jgi:hypothetical protein
MSLTNGVTVDQHSFARLAPILDYLQVSALPFSRPRFESEKSQKEAFSISNIVNYFTLSERSCPVCKRMSSQALNTLWNILSSNP